MPIFMTQGRYTGEAIKGMVAKPEDRSRAVRQLMAASDAKLLSFYMAFGEYDFVVIAEAPSEKAMASALLAAAAGGGVTDLKTSLLMTPADMKAAFEASGEIAQSFRSAGGVKG